MTSIYDVSQTELVEKIAQKLKSVKEVYPKPWSAFVKTGVSKERPPVRKDWWYYRAASILLAVYKFGPIGVSKLRIRYGAKKNNGVAPEHFYKASGAIIRNILQQLTNAGFLKQAEKGIHKGRVITPAGKSFCDKAASELIGSSIAVNKDESKPVKNNDSNESNDSKSEKQQTQKPIRQKTKAQEKNQINN